MNNAMAENLYVNGWNEVSLEADSNLVARDNVGYTPMNAGTPARSITNLRFSEDEYGYLEINEDVNTNDKVDNDR